MKNLSEQVREMWDGAVPVEAGTTVGPETAYLRKDNYGRIVLAERSRGAFRVSGDDGFEYRIGAESVRPAPGSWGVVDAPGARLDGWAARVCGNGNLQVLDPESTEYVVYRVHEKWPRIEGKRMVDK